MEEYVPLIQTALWVALVLVFALPLRTVVRKRIEAGHGAKIGAGVFSIELSEAIHELGRALPALPPAGHAEGEDAPDNEDSAAGNGEAGRDRPARPSGDAARDPDDTWSVPHWEQLRRAEKGKSRRIHLAHIATPGTKPGYFDLLVLLVAERKGNLSDVVRAQFYLGRYWNNRVFTVHNNGGQVGFTASAYGPTLCLCRVVFRDRSEAVLSRYLDFETGRLLARTDSTARESA